ncbi:MAG: adenine phosphoribosyltransferase [Myxococcales bacterium]|nr:adenine phosphoribosyltransferase [Myxococcales bacterium]
MMDDLKALIRTIPDFPKPGIMFRDVTTLMNDGAGFQKTIAALTERYRGQRLDKIAGIEARGFILGGAIAAALGVGFVPLRKKGKLPGEAIGEDYALEYGTDRIEMHLGAVAAGERVLIVDDLIATGGTAEAAIRLIRAVHGEVVEACFVIDLPDLGGVKRLADLGCASFCLLAFEGH